MTLPSDRSFMQSALDLAIGGLGHVEPNPMVGCVIVRDGVIIGRGYHAKFGGPHAEVAALRSLDSVGDAIGATAYVTLEPCSHHGKTGPCADALIEAKIGRVVVAMEDPFGEVSGRGIARLRDAGIDVTVGVMAREAGAVVAPFVKRVTTGLPWVIAKWAMTIDGRIATKTGDSQWITSPESRAAVHQLRSRVDAIVAGMGTVSADNPQLTARLTDAAASPPRVATRVIFCRHRLPAIDSMLVQTIDRAPLMLVCGPAIDRDELGRLSDAGATILDADEDAMVPAALAKLAQNGATNVMLEGGSKIFGSFFACNNVDECHVYLGPKAFGGAAAPDSAAAPGPVGGVGVEKVSQAWTFSLGSVDRFGDDVRLIYRR